MEQENYIPYKITDEQAKRICEYYGKDINQLEEYEICELLDKIIDELDMTIKDDLPF